MPRLGPEHSRPRDRSRQEDVSTSEPPHPATSGAERSRPTVARSSDEVFVWGQQGSQRYSAHQQEQHPIATPGDANPYNYYGNNSSTDLNHLSTARIEQSELQQEEPPSYINSNVKWEHGPQGKAKKKECKSSLSRGLNWVNRRLGGPMDSYNQFKQVQSEGRKARKRGEQESRILSLLWQEEYSRTDEFGDPIPPDDDSQRHHHDHD